MDGVVSLEVINEFRAAGRRSEAESACRRFLAVYPENPDALWLLGALCHEGGRGKEAMVMLGRAIKGARTTGRAPPLDWSLSLGAVQQQQGAREEALISFSDAVRDYPRSADARFCLATAYQSLGRPGEAAKNYRAVLELDPGNADAANNLGLLLLEKRQLGAAEQAFRHALRFRPLFGDALLNYGSLLQRSGRFPEAQNILVRAAKALPDDPGLQRVLAQNEIYLGDVPAAATRIELALKRHGDRPDMLSQLAAIRLFQGRRGDAIVLCGRALAVDRTCAAAHFYLAAAEHDLDDPALLDDIRRSLTAPGIAARERALLYFAGGDRLDAMQQYEEAFSWYRQGNELRVQMLAAAGTLYDRAKHETHVSRLMESFSEAATSSATTGSGSSVPVFIVGMPRSGTSLVEQILSTHSRVAGAGELMLVGEEAARLARLEGYPEHLPDAAALKRFAEGYIGRLSRIGAGSQYVTDKNPANFLNLGLIALALPNARVIHCRRDRRDVALSCYFQNFVGPGQAFSYDLGDLAHYHDAYLRLMRHWQGVLPLAMIDIDYEALVADQEAETRRMLAFLGLEWEPACLDFQHNRRTVATASHTQVRQPIYSRSVGRWRNYAHEMGFAVAR